MPPLRCIQQVARPCHCPATAGIIFLSLVHSVKLVLRLSLSHDDLQAKPPAADLSCFMTVYFCRNIGTLRSTSIPNLCMNEISTTAWQLTT
ncbi:Protein of unknown function [Pyronema omphalodes CBS 100304]|uniref:Uncharacterized protein n=1 Tax=Pyronema omphalodes (strain CBS 100304) TaxID=1076935 RepID=U4LAH4_PYROM|nr:Protein of unknown function [Pyronema omphalodes CBS 100304]